MKYPYAVKTEYLVFILACLFWLSDAFMDHYMVTGSRNRFFLGVESGLFLHTMVFAVQLAFIIYVSMVVRRARTLQESLESAERATKEETNKVNAILEAMVDPVSVQDTNYRVLYQNQAHREFIGEHRGEFCYRAYVGKESVCDDCHLAKTFADGIPHRKEISLQHRTPPVEIEILSSPLRDSTGTIIAGIEVIRDVTRWKRTEEEIRQLNQDLERRARDLAASYRELEAFSYSVSHDLRTPLTRIYSAAQILEEQYAESLDDDGKFLLRTICQGGEHMEELIEALMDLAKVTRSEMTTEEVDLVPVALEIMSELQETAPERKVRFIAPPELSVTGDRQLLTVLLENLLGNAWKYTGKTDSPVIELGANTTPDRSIYFVRDNGAGFKMQDVEKLFKPFRRLHSATDFPGTGVGLATVHRIIQRHGGETWAEGEPDKGATFFFTLG